MRDDGRDYASKMADAGVEVEQVKLHARTYAHICTHEPICTHAPIFTPAPMHIAGGATRPAQLL